MKSRLNEVKQSGIFFSRSRRPIGGMVSILDGTGDWYFRPSSRRFW